MLGNQGLLGGIILVSAVFKYIPRHQHPIGMHRRLSTELFLDVTIIKAILSGVTSAFGMLDKLPKHV